MFAQSNMRPCYFRYGYDIALPLRARKLYPRLRDIAPLDRKYFATFKASGAFPYKSVRTIRAVGFCRGPMVAWRREPLPPLPPSTFNRDILLLVSVAPPIRTGCSMLES